MRRMSNEIEYGIERKAFEREVHEAVQSGKISVDDSEVLLTLAQTMTTDELWKEKTRLRNTIRIEIAS